MSIHWREESEQDRPLRVPDDVADLHFRVGCRRLLSDHAWALYRALVAVLPWLDDEPLAAIHSIHGAESGSGWTRPQGERDEIHLSRRARLRLRLPRQRFDDARALAGATLDVGGYAVVVGAAAVHPLSRETTLFTRRLAAPANGDEDAFLEQAAFLLRQKGIVARKMMSGRRRIVRASDKEITVSSLMVGGLTFDETIRLQQQGLGDEQKLGCGIFLPHKSIEAVR